MKWKRNQEIKWELGTIWKAIEGLIVGCERALVTTNASNQDPTIIIQLQE